MKRHFFWCLEEIVIPLQSLIAEIAQLVEHNLAKVGVAGPSPVFRSIVLKLLFLGYISISELADAAMVELVDTRDLKSLGQ